MSEAPEQDSVRANSPDDDRTIVNTHTDVPDDDRTIVNTNTDLDCDRTVVSSAATAGGKQNDALHPNQTKRDLTGTHFSLFNLDHTWFQSGKDVNERINRNRQASMEKVRLDAIHAFQNTDLYPELAPKDALYEHVKVFNEGGQGIISKVREKSLDRIVALKSLRKELLSDDSARRNFITEAKVSAQLEHPSIIPIYALAGDDEKGLHLAMKLISGMTLTNYLEETCQHYKLDGVRHFNEAKALRFRLDLFLRICDAMSYAHGHNIMHRDLKPENIIIGEYREVYVMDWGIATHIITQAEDAEDGKKHVSGTPRFMAPEVIRGEAIDQRADVYALGLILFELVYLKTGYTGKTTQEIFGKVLRGECESFEHYFGCKVSPELTAIVKKAMHPNLGVRYQSVEDLAQDIRRHLDGEETKALPDNTGAKILRYIGKHRRSVVVIIALLLLLGLSNAAYNFYQQRNEQIYRTRYNRAVGYATSKADDAAYNIESQMLKLESILQLFSAETAFRLANPPEATDRIALLPMNVDPTGNERAGYCAAYNQVIDPAHMGYFIAKNNSNPAAVMEEVKKLTPMSEKTIQRFLTSDLPGGEVVPPLNELEKRLLENGNPILWMYFGSENGLYFQYPRGSTLTDSYDPRLRNWYAIGKTAADDALSWGQAYEGVQTKSMMLTCSQPIRVNGKFVGVTALDVSLEQFRKLMETYGMDPHYTTGKYLLDHDGNILVSTQIDSSVQSANQKPLSNIRELSQALEGWKEESGATLTGEDLFNRMWWGDLGHVVMTKDGEKVMILYSRIRSQRWLYVEVVDLDLFMKENWNDLDDLDKLEKKLQTQREGADNP